MTTDAQALAALTRWAVGAGARIHWQVADDSRHPSLDFEVAEPFAARLLAADSSWMLDTSTSRGSRSTKLGSTELPPGDVFTAVLEALYVIATDEFDDVDRAGSEAVAQVLRLAADESGQALFGARSASLLAGHAIKNGYGLQASLRLEEAAALFTAAGDDEAAASVLEVLRTLPQLLRA